MRTRWLGLRKSLAWSIKNQKADSDFKAAVNAEKILARFLDLDTLASYLVSKGTDLDEKDRVYAALVRLVQSRSETSKLAATLCLLGLWPGLTTIFSRKQRDFSSGLDGLIADITFVFIHAILRIDLTRASRVAATLVRNVARNVRRILERGRLEEGRVAEFAEVIKVKLHPDPPPKDGREALVDTDNIPSTLEWLSRIVTPDEVDVVVTAMLRDLDLREVGDVLGIGYDVARKRYQRALRRIRAQRKPYH